MSTLTLQTLTSQAQQQLEAAGVSDCEIAARRIVAEAAGLTIAELVLEAKTLATNRTVAKTDEMLGRSSQGEPLQYVLGRWGFRGLDLAVDKRAFIPRPETESIAEEVISHLKRLAAGASTAADVGTVGASSQTPPSVSVVDLGTGTGAIALSIAQEVPEAVVYATDYSQHALELARENLAGLGLAAARVTLCHGNWFDALEPELFGQLDAIVSNPPYVPAGQELPAEVTDWEPKMALFSGADGLVDLHQLIAEARFYLSPLGMLALECGPEQVEALTQKLLVNGYEYVSVIKDLAGKERGVKAVRPQESLTFNQLKHAVDALQSDGIVVAPTDTVCGVLADYTNPAAVRNVYSAKGRPETMPLPVLVSGLEQAERLVVLNPDALRLAQQHWPGALTLVAPRRGGPDPVGGHTTLGVRVPDLGWLRWLAEQIGPLTGTSANCHRKDTPRLAAEAAEALVERPMYVIEGESPPHTVASTVVNVCERTPVVLREGELKSIDLLKD